MALVFVVLSAVFAGLNLPALKYGLTELSPVLLMLIRFAAATLVIWLIYRPKIQKTALKASFLSAGALLLIILGLSLSTISYVQAILAFIPVAVGLGAHHLLGEKQTLKSIAGILLGLGGTLFIIFEVKISGTNGHQLVIGNLLVFFSAILSALYIVECRKLSKTISSIDLTFNQFVATTFVFILGMFAMAILGKPLVVSETTNVSLYSLIYLIIFGTVLMFFFYQKGIKQTNAYVVGLSQYLQLPVGVLSGVILFSDKISPVFILGTGLILAGSLIGTFNHLSNEKS
ncbi:hypothetical protein A2886_02970 [candidate division WWE3 bacterium RIFCSPHIGHO2_01_FULL_42_13]|uniref:EamA domain-containing protein n=1 Tax=candidate division WWE3 bacterium RIFCSPHIGHO2_01_FULL_42_13 TaxID=1802617 RepID=A0A1F4URV2_UNCKA|nr:MAG: hypothetical protein A2886_02970 [candidate division WWE3 bacterium RIFCSPHIGHO2_01_FULL_42_13]